MPECGRRCASRDSAPWRCIPISTGRRSWSIRCGSTACSDHRSGATPFRRHGHAPAAGLSSPPLFSPSLRAERLSTPARVAVLASGGGSNLQALIDRLNAHPTAPARVELVVGSRAGIGALERAERAGIDAVALDARALGPEAFAGALADALESHR